MSNIDAMENAFEKFTLHQAGLRDLQALREMERVCFPLDAWPLIELIGALTLPAVVRIKAVADNRLIGFVGGDIRRGQKLGWITTLSVLPEYRRLGVGNALLDACEQVMGMPLVKLCVRKSNLEAQTLYLKRGYVQRDVWKKFYEGGEDALVLEKDLPEFRM